MPDAMQTLAQSLTTARECYCAWGLNPPTNAVSEKKFLSLLKEIQPRIGEHASRIVPSSFTNDDPELLALPRPIDGHVPSWIAACEELRPRIVMMHFPTFWQLEAPLEKAARRANATIFTGDPHNLPLGAAAIQIGTVDTVASEAENALDFLRYLSEEQIPHPEKWLIVHRADRATWKKDVIEISGLAFHEVHLFPGVPVLTQCPALAKRKTLTFHVAENYHAEIEPEHVLLTSSSKEPFPFAQYIWRVKLIETGLCSCGKQMYRHLP